MGLQVRSLALLGGLRILCCHELWCRSQTRLGSCIAVALGVGHRPAATALIRPLVWELPYAMGGALKRPKKKERKKRKAKEKPTGPQRQQETLTPTPIDGQVLQMDHQEGSRDKENRGT